MPSKKFEVGQKVVVTNVNARARGPAERTALTGRSRSRK